MGLGGGVAMHAWGVMLPYGAMQLCIHTCMCDGGRGGRGKTPMKFVS